MSDDIVKRLRLDHARTDGMFPILGEAADEIERLREKTQHIRQWLRAQANAEKGPKAKAAFIEAHNAVLVIIEDVSEADHGIGSTGQAQLFRQV